MHQDTLQEEVTIRALRAQDLEAVIALDAKTIGRKRDEYFRLKLKQNLAETGIQVSLAAELEGAFCGFLLARVYYGEFGSLEPVAVLETLDVHPDFRRRGVGAALLRQLRLNLRGLRVSRLRTEVAWGEQRLMAFFHREGFQPAPRFSLDCDLDTPERSENPDDAGDSG